MEVPSAAKSESAAPKILRRVDRGTADLQLGPLTVITGVQLYPIEVISRYTNIIPYPFYSLLAGLQAPFLPLNGHKS